jgi:nicotinate-nucleotide adenylyltransferase
MKVGVLGGTFDPVHLAHLGMAQEARNALELDEVIIVPAGQPVFKSSDRVTPAALRLEMLRLALVGRPYLKISRIEIERQGPSYTVDTLSVLKKQYGPGAELYFILGWDSLAQLPVWREPQRIIAMCRLVVVPRPGFPRPAVEALEEKLPGIIQKVTFLDRPNLDISATKIREKVRKGESIDGLVPGPVAAYIKKQKLYLEQQE